MNRDESFEKRLQRQTPREIPAAWREEILDATRAASAPRASIRSTITLREKVISLLWPHPTAWAALATIWIVVLGLHFFTRDTSENIFARHTTRPSRQIRELIQEKERLFAELIGPTQPADADRPKPNAPHSRRREEFLNA